MSTSVMRPTFVEVDLQAITSNYQSIFAKAKNTKVMIVLKANAYGHGLIKIAAHLESLGVAYFGVAYLEEGIMIREAGIKTPILVMGGIVGEQIPLFIKNELTITASSIDKLTEIEMTAKRLNREAIVHLKIDTGMERIGTHYYSARRLLEKAEACTHVRVEGIYTHLANADESNLSHSRLQIKRFRQVLDFYDGRNTRPQFVHACNSGGFLQLPEAWFDMVRIGIIVYGVYPSEHLRGKIGVKPAMNWKSRVVYFKVVKPGHPVSYGSTWSAAEETRVVTCPAGYGDGYMRAISNKAEVLIRGRRYPVIGNICMDQFMVDIGRESAYNNDEVVLVGKQGKETILIEDLADWAGTIPYEILTNINTRVPRVYLS